MTTTFLSLLLLAIPSWTLTVTFPTLNATVREPIWRAYLDTSSSQSIGSLIFDAPPQSAACRFRLSQLTPIDQKASRQLISLSTSPTWTIWPAVSMAACNTSSSSHGPCLFTAGQSAIKVKLRDIQQVDKIGSWALRNRTLHFRSEVLDSDASVSCIHFETFPGDHCRVVQKAAWCSRTTAPRSHVTISSLQPANGPLVLNLERRKLQSPSRTCEHNLVDEHSSAWLGRWNPGRSGMTYIATVGISQHYQQCQPSIEIGSSVSVRVRRIRLLSQIKTELLEDSTHVVIEGVTKGGKFRVYPILHAPSEEGHTTAMTQPPSCFAFDNITVSRISGSIKLTLLYLCHDVLRPLELTFQLSDDSLGTNAHVFYTAPMPRNTQVSSFDLPLPLRELTPTSKIQILLGRMPFTIPLPLSVLDSLVPHTPRSLPPLLRIQVGYISICTHSDRVYTHTQNVHAASQLHHDILPLSPQTYEFQDVNAALGLIEGLLLITIDALEEDEGEVDYFLRVDQFQRSTWYQPADTSAVSNMQKVT